MVSKPRLSSSRRSHGNFHNTSVISQRGSVEPKRNHPSSFLDLLLRTGFAAGRKALSPTGAIPFWRVVPTRQNGMALLERQVSGHETKSSHNYSTSTAQIPVACVMHCAFHNIKAWVEGPFDGALVIEKSNSRALRFLLLVGQFCWPHLPR